MTHVKCLTRYVSWNDSCEHVSSNNTCELDMCHRMTPVSYLTCLIACHESIGSYVRYLTSVALTCDERIGGYVTLCIGTSDASATMHQCIGVLRCVAES